MSFATSGFIWQAREKNALTNDGVLEYRSIGVLGLNALLHYFVTPILPSLLEIDPAPKMCGFSATLGESHGNQSCGHECRPGYL